MITMSRTIRHPRLGLIIGLTCALGLSFALVSLVAATYQPTKGPVPFGAAIPGRPIDAEAVPDFVSVLGRDGAIVGYSPKERVLRPAVAPGFRGESLPVPVYAEDLRTLVGHLVPGRGFVPAGAPIEGIPEVDVSAAPSSAD